MSEQKTFDLSLYQSLKGTLKQLVLGFCITDIGEGEQDCYLYKLQLSGGPTLLFDEWELKPQNKSFKGDQTWVMGPRRYTEEEDVDAGIEKEVISVHSLVLRTTKNGGSMARAALGKSGGDVLATENWKE